MSSGKGKKKRDFWGIHGFPESGSLFFIQFLFEILHGRQIALEGFRHQGNELVARDADRGVDHFQGVTGQNLVFGLQIKIPMLLLSQLFLSVSSTA
jgi:hypothetical protein